MSAPFPPPRRAAPPLRPGVRKAAAPPASGYPPGAVLREVPAHHHRGEGTGPCAPPRGGACCGGAGWWAPPLRAGVGSAEQRATPKNAPALVGVAACLSCQPRWQPATPPGGHGASRTAGHALVPTHRCTYRSSPFLACLCPPIVVPPHGLQGRSVPPSLRSVRYSRRRATRYRSAFRPRDPGTRREEPQAAQPQEEPWSS